MLALTSFAQAHDATISEAIQDAFRRGLVLCNYTSPIDDAAEGITPERAEELASEDPGLVYIQ